MEKELEKDCDAPKCTRGASQKCPICLDSFCLPHLAIHVTRCGVPDEHPEIPEMMA